MNQPFTQNHDLDKDGNPDGGYSVGTGMNIQWQKGPLQRGEERLEPNGAFVETVIAAVIGRIRFYQTGDVAGEQEGAGGKFACRENALAVTHLEEALHWLNHRTQKREARGVEGTHTA
jgi:hypothetical protein